MTDAEARPRVRRGLWIAGLVVVLLALGVIVHFVISGALAGFPIEMISRGRSWIFIGGYLVVGYIGLLLLGLARPRFKPGKPRTIEPVDSTRAVSRLEPEPEPEPEPEETEVDDGPPSLPTGASEGCPTSNSDEVLDDEV